MAVHANTLTVSVKAISTFIATSLPRGSILRGGKVLPGYSVAPGTARMLLDNGSIPLGTETCQRVANATQVKVATATRSKQLHPRVGHGVESREMLGIMPPQASVTFYVKQRCS
jgi:hypothetical protein